MLLIAWALLTELQEWEANRVGGVPFREAGIFRLAWAGVWVFLAGNHPPRGPPAACGFCFPSHVLSMALTGWWFVSLSSVLAPKRDANESLNACPMLTLSTVTAQSQPLAGLRLLCEQAPAGSCYLVTTSLPPHPVFQSVPLKRTDDFWTDDSGLCFSRLLLPASAG